MKKTLFFNLRLATTLNMAFDTFLLLRRVTISVLAAAFLAARDFDTDCSYSRLHVVFLIFLEESIVHSLSCCKCVLHCRPQSPKIEG